MRVLAVDELRHVHAAGGRRGKERGALAEQRLAAGGCKPHIRTVFEIDAAAWERGLPEEGAGSAHWGCLNPIQEELTMAPCVLYQRLCQQLQRCVPGLGVWQRRRLALLVTGLLLARHTALPRVAAQLRRVHPATHTDSIERRLRRIL